VLHRAHEDALVLLRRLRHGGGLLGAARERPLAQHVLAGLERRHRHRGVQEVGGADVDGVDASSLRSSSKRV